MNYPAALRIADLPTAIGTSSTGGWFLVSQRRIDEFADATDDRQWIHVDPVRAAEGPFAGTIAHGFLTLSLLSSLVGEILVVSDAASVINYGLDRVRFIAPVPSGSRIRATVTIAAVDTVPRGARVTLDTDVHVEGSTAPTLVARQIVLYTPQ